MKFLFLVRIWPWLLILIAIVAFLQPAQASPPTQIITVSPTIIPFSEPELVNPMRGYYRWYDTEVVPQPGPAQDHYARFGWRSLEPARGQYDFSEIERALETAKNTGAKFSFRIMSVNEFTSPVEIPRYLVSEAGGTYCSYNGSQVWIPNWDSPQFLARAQALMSALSSHFNGDARLGYYDIGLYGHWGEWHTDGLCTPAASATSKRSLVDMQVAAFSKSRMLMNSGGKELDAFVYALNKSPRIGIRVDSLCNPWFENQFTELPEKLALIQERWKTAPIITEFYDTNPSNLELCDQQLQKWHVAALANARLSWSSYSADQQQLLVDLGKHAGYRFALTQLSYPAEQANNAVISISSQWRNFGITPAYEHVAIMYELRPAGQNSVLWTGSSTLDLEQLLPNTVAQSVSDQLYIPGRLPPGRYTLSLVIRDPKSYRAPLQLAIVGVNAQGRYELGVISITQGLPGYDVFLPSVYMATTLP